MAHQIQIQDGFLFGCLKEKTVLGFQLINGKQIKGRIGRFDRYCIVVDIATDSGSGTGGEFMLYKHALVGILSPNGVPNQRDAGYQRSREPRRTRRPAYAS